MIAETPFRKRPGESYAVGIEWAGVLPTGTSIASGIVTATSPAGVDDSAAVLGSTQAVVDGTQTKVLWTGGVSGQVDTLLFTATLSNGYALQEPVLAVIE